MLAFIVMISLHVSWPVNYYFSFTITSYSQIHVYITGGYYNAGPNSGYINQQTSTMGMTQPQTQSMYMPAMSDYVNLPPATAPSTVAPAVTKALTSPPMTSTAPTTAGSAPVDKVP